MDWDSRVSVYLEMTEAERIEHFLRRIEALEDRLRDLEDDVVRYKDES
jgi:hypothetical protein